MKRSEALAAAICEHVANGRSLRDICRDDDMPAQSMVFAWLADDAKFQEQYARARERQADFYAEEILQIADDGRNDKIVTEDGIVLIDHDHIARSRLRVDSRKWIASKLAPKKYGDKLEVGGEITHAFIARVPEKAESAEEWANTYAPKRLPSGKLNGDRKRH